MADRHEYPTIVIERRSGGLGAFVLGALIGAGAALLLAPRTGEETRGELRSGVRRLRERAESTVRDLQRVVVDSIDDVREEVTGRLDAAREAFEAGREAARQSRRELERKLDDARARGRQEPRPPADEFGSTASATSPSGETAD